MPLRPDPSIRQSVSQNYNEIMNQTNRFGAASIANSKNTFEQEEEQEENTIFGKSKTRKVEPKAPEIPQVSAEEEKKKQEEERRKKEEAELMMKKTTFNDDALFKKKNTAAQIIMGKKPEPKKNIFDEESEEEESPLTKPIKKK